MSKNIVVWTDIPVTDLSRAIAFYAKVLAAPVELQNFGEHSMGVLPHAGDGCSGCLTLSGDNKPSRTGPLIYLTVDGRLDEAEKLAGENGGEILEAKHPIGPYGFRSVIIDSEGNRIALHSQTA